jgi:hypothetical protein
VAWPRLFTQRLNRRNDVPPINEFVPSLYAKALHAMPDAIDGQPPLPVSKLCPVTLDEMVAPV